MLVDNSSLFLMRFMAASISTMIGDTLSGPASSGSTCGTNGSGVSPIHPPTPTNPHPPIHPHTQLTTTLVRFLTDADLGSGRWGSGDPVVWALTGELRGTIRLSSTGTRLLGGILSAGGTATTATASVTAGRLARAQKLMHRIKLPGVAVPKLNHDDWSGILLWWLCPWQKLTIILNTWQGF